jgi:hypothetical protein
MMKYLAAPSTSSRRASSPASRIAARKAATEVRGLAVKGCLLIVPSDDVVASICIFAMKGRPGVLIEAIFIGPLISSAVSQTDACSTMTHHSPRSSSSGNVERYLVCKLI